MIPFNTCSDTDSATRELLFSRLRELSVEERFSRFADACQFIREIVITGIKERHPGSSEFELRKRYAAITLGPELAAKYFDWDQLRDGM
jgi:hypothetical protein